MLSRLFFFALGFMILHLLRSFNTEHPHSHSTGYDQDGDGLADTCDLCPSDADVSNRADACQVCAMLFGILKFQNSTCLVQRITPPPLQLSLSESYVTVNDGIQTTHYSKVGTRL